MFIRESATKIGSKQYRQCRLVETYYTDQGPRQRHLLSLGEMRLDRSRWKLLCKQIEEGMRGEAAMAGVVDEEVRAEAERIVERLRRRQGKPSRPGQTTARVVVDEVEVEDAREVGPVYVGMEMWKRLGMEKILERTGMSRRMRRLCEIEVVGRLVEARSERGTAEWFKRVGMKDVWGDEMGEVTEDGLYRASDALLKQKEVLEGELAKEEEGLFGEDTSHLFLYDLTSVYFEGSGKSNEKARRGHNREGRGDCVQEVVGLVLDGKGRVKGHEIFEGNRTDTKTLVDMVRILEKRFGGKRGTVVMDRGLSSEGNLKFLREEGYTYVVATRRSEMEAWLEDEKYREVCERALAGVGKPVSVAGWKEGEEQYLFCHSQGRKMKEEAIRTRFEKRMEEALGKLSARIASKKLVDPVKIQRAIGRIRQRHSRVARWYDVNLVEDENPRRLQWSHRLDQSQEHARWEGSYLLRTSRVQWSDDELWKVYMLLTRVEAAFRNFKTDLGVRPIFHQKEKRSDAHIFITILAYHLLHAIEMNLRDSQDTRTWSTIRACLSTHQAVTIVMPRADGSRILLRKPTKPEAEHMAIYQKLKISPRAFPQRRLIVQAKL